MQLGAILTVSLLLSPLRDRAPATEAQVTALYLRGRRCTAAPNEQERPTPHVPQPLLHSLCTTPTWDGRRTHAHRMLLREHSVPRHLPTLGTHRGGGARMQIDTLHSPRRDRGQPRDRQFGAWRGRRRVRRRMLRVRPVEGGRRTLLVELSHTAAPRRTKTTTRDVRRDSETAQHHILCRYLTRAHYATARRFLPLPCSSFLFLFFPPFLFFFFFFLFFFTSFSNLVRPFFHTFPHFLHFLRFFFSTPLPLSMSLLVHLFAILFRSFFPLSLSFLTIIH